MDKFEYIIADCYGPSQSARGSLADLILDAHMITRCGLVPPFRVLRTLLRRGSAGGGMSPGCKWDPIELTEQDYWQVVEELERIKPDDFQFRYRDPQIVGEIRPDYNAPDTDDPAKWLASLVHRGYLPGGPFRETRR